MKTRNPAHNVVIRPAAVEDIPAVIALNRDGILLWSRGFQPAIREWMESVCNHAYFEDLILSPEKSLLVAEREGVTVGTAYGYPINGKFHTGGMYLSVRGLGVATLLMAGLITQTRKLGLKELTSTIHEQNYAALRFVSRTGWVHKDEEKFNGINFYNRTLVLF